MALWQEGACSFHGMEEGQCGLEHGERGVDKFEEAGKELDTKKGLIDQHEDFHL